MSLKDDIEVLKNMAEGFDNLNIKLGFLDRLSRIKAALALDDGSSKLESLKDLLKVQGQDGNWNYCDYMTGMYNGMELSVAILEGCDPNYRDCLKDDGPPREGDVCAWPISGNNTLVGTLSKSAMEDLKEMGCDLGQPILLMRAEEVERRIKEPGK